MNVRAPALAKTQRIAGESSAFAQDVIEGLSQHPKRLPPKYFYDDAGSELFEQITRQDRERLIHFIFDRQRMERAKTRGDDDA